MVRGRFLCRSQTLARISILFDTVVLECPSDYSLLRGQALKTRNEVSVKNRDWKPGLRANEAIDGNCPGWLRLVPIQSNPGGGNPGYLQPSDDLGIDH